MLNLIRIKRTESDEYNYIESLLVDSFPTDEYRELGEQRKNTREKENFELLYAATDDGPIGFVSLWNFDNFSYIEHLAIHPQKRNMGYGQMIMQNIKERKNYVVLETELPDDDIKKRRISFYEHLGFKIYDNEYIQPAYKSGSNEIKMNLMYWGAKDTKLPFEDVKNKIHTYIYNV